MADAPARIFATVNGRKNIIYLGLGKSAHDVAVGGWCEVRDRPHAVEYIRADVVAEMVREAKEGRRD